MIAWVLTWLWQGLALVAAVSLFVGLFGRVSAGTRALVWLASLVMLVWLGWALAVDPAVAATRIAPAPMAAPQAPSPALVTVPVLPLAGVLALGALWVLAAGVGLVRLAAAGRILWRLKRGCDPLPRAREHRLPLWCRERDRGRRARLVVSDVIGGPAVLGLVRPCIALPRHVIDRIDDRDLDQVVLHELAHVRRWDDWTRLLQALVQLVLGVHPAVWWAARALSFEREAACDEWVVARSGAPRAYARCLSRLATLQANRSRVAVLPALTGHGGELVRRVDRLLAWRPATRRSSYGSLAAGAGVVMMLAGLLHGLPPLVAAPAAPVVYPRLPPTLGRAAIEPVPAPAAPPVVPPSVAPAPIEAAAAVRSGQGVLVSGVSTSGSGQPAGPVSLARRRAPPTSALARAPLAAIDRVVTAAPLSPVVHPTLPAGGSSAGARRWPTGVGVGIGLAFRDAGVATAGAFSSAAQSLGRWFHGTSP